jgi:RHS repeat-associated protein
MGLALMKIYSFLLTALIFNIPLFGKEAQKALELLPPSVTEMGISPIAYNYVNVITGDFVDSATDIVVTGPESLSFERSFSGSSRTESCLYYGWRHNHQSWIDVLDTKGKMTPTSKKKNCKEAKYMEKSGRGSFFLGERNRDMPTVLMYHPDLNVNHTNCGEGIISARNNLKNAGMTILNGNATINMPNGFKYTFERTDNAEGNEVYLLKAEQKPNGHWLYYERDDAGRITSIKLKNSTGNREFSSLSLKHESYENLKKEKLDWEIEASDGRKIKYKLKKLTKKHEDGSKKRYYCISEIERPNGPKEKYTYTLISGIPKMIWKERPDKRVLVLDYYSLSGNEEVGGQTVQVNSHKRYLNGRIKKIDAPVGENDEIVPVCSLVYKPNIKRKSNETASTEYFDKDIIDGSTYVYDALNHQTKYEYDDKFRLTSIKKYTGSSKDNYKSYSEEKILWSTKEKPGEKILPGNEKTPIEEGYLLGKFVRRGSDHVVYHGHQYEYDKFGNIEKDTFFGNITGHSKPIVWDGDSPQDNRCDRYATTYEYSKSDVLHLMTKQTEDNGKGVKYTYKPGTDLLASKLITDNGKICIRNFYEYDEDAILTKTIVDNGTTDNKEDLTGVTERHISKIYPTESQPYGLPARIEDYYYDPETKKEVNLKWTYNKYSREGYLEKQEVYDSEGNFAYLLEWKYNDHGLVTYEKNAEGHVTKKAYDDNDNLIEEEIPYSANYESSDKPIYVDRKILHTYDKGNRKTSTTITTDGIPQTTFYKYNSLSNCTSSTDIYGNDTHYTYDEFNRVTKTVYPKIPTENGSMITPSTSQEYDILGNVILFTDQQGTITRKAYNVYGKVTNVWYSDGTQESFAYNLDGTLRKSVACNGVATHFKTDYLGRVTSTEIYSAKGILLSSTEAEYDAFHLLKSKDASGNITHYKYDGAGRLISEQCGEHFKTYEYDPMGRVSVTKEWYGDTPNAFRAKIQSYDKLDRIISEKCVDGETQEEYQICHYSYDSDGNIIIQKVQTSDKLSKTKTYYNCFKQPVQIIDAAGIPTYIHYNKDSQNAYGQRVLEIAKVDILNNCTLTQMNTHGKPEKVIKKNAGGHEISKKEIFYNAVGDCQYVKETIFTPDAANKVIGTYWEYDSHHRLRKLVEGMKSKVQKSTCIEYNRLGQKEAITKSNGTKIFHEYDDFGRLSLFRAGDNSFSYKYTYDLDDNVTRIEDLILGTETVRDFKFHRLMQETLGNGLSVSYVYDRLDRPVEVKLPDDSAIHYRYNGIHLKTINRYTKEGKISYSHQYVSHDPTGKVTQAVLPGKAGKETVQYDILGRLVHTQSSKWSEDITYNTIGNITNVKAKENDVSTHCQYDFDDHSQLKSETGFANHTFVNNSMYNCVKVDGNERTFNDFNQMLKDQNGSYSYDENGNLIKKEVNGKFTKFTYDAQDRLVNVVKGENKYVYTYDAFNRRLSKQTLVLNNSEWHEIDKSHYLYQGQNEVGVCDPVSKEMKEFRVLGIGKGAEIGASIAIEVGGETAVPVHDHNGNIVQLLDLDGDIIESYRYSAFGEEKIFQNGTEVVGSSFGNSWRFSSKRKDEETGFVYFGRRYYDPSTYRWVSPDPIGFDGGPNLYAYVMNSPLCHIDLYGLVGIKPNRFFSMQNNIKNTFGKLSSLADYGFKNLGSLVYNIGRHMLPIPIMESVVRSFGNFLQGKGFKVAPNEHSTQNLVGDHRSHPYVTYGIATGMGNTREEALATAEAKSENMRGHEIHTTHKADYGISFNIFEFFAQKFGFITESVKMAMQDFHHRSVIAMQHPDGACYQEAHSQGGMNTYMGLKSLTPEQRKRWYVETYGSAKIIDPNELGLAYAMNYISWLDFIPFIGDPIGCIKALFSSRRYVTFLPGLNPFKDHLYLGAVYNPIAEGRERNFVRTYGYFK